MLESIAKKTSMIEAALRNADLDKTFEYIQAQEDLVFFRAFQNLNGQRVAILITIEDSIYTVGRIQFGSLTNSRKKDDILELVNELNNESKVFEYVLNEDNDNTLEIRFTHISRTEDFDGELVLWLAVNAFAELQDESYKKFMRILWG